METHSALYIFWWCGLAGLLVDLDHIIAFIWGYWNPEISNGRIWHAPLFLLSGIAICYLLSSRPGFYSKLVLAGVALATAMILVYSPWVIWGLYE